jgi:hypothetical protein
MPSSKTAKVFRGAGNKATGGIHVVLERTAMRTVGWLMKSVAYTLSVALIGVLSSFQMASAGSNPGTEASYNGGTINLSFGWGTATVCAITVSGTNCFASQSQYQAWLGAQPALSGLALPNGSGNCSSGLQLFQNTGYSGREISIFVLSDWINLSAYSFANEVSSYKVGACAVSMTDGANGSGNVYPGATSPGSDVTWIGTAWNDRVQSVYVY